MRRGMCLDLFRWRGKGYRSKLLALFEAIPAFFLFRVFNCQNWKYERGLVHGCSTHALWFVARSVLQNPPPVMRHLQAGAAFEAERLLVCKFSILGEEMSHSGGGISWNIDPVSGHTWPDHYFKRLYPVATTAGNADVKFPWELSRFQQLPRVIAAFAATENRQYVNQAINHIRCWIEENPCPYGINWTCAMEVAIRACNWMWAWWAFGCEPEWTDQFNESFLKALWQHGWFIEHNLEDKGGVRTNHYLSNVVGLLFLGIMLPQHRDAMRWKNFGIRELVNCMDEMVYPDGVSFENATAYHRLVLEFFAYSALLCQRNGVSLPAPFWARIEKMFEFIMHCTRPDGRMPMVGDADDGRFFILCNYYDWDRWDHRYLLAIGSVLFSRGDFKAAAGRFHEEVWWLLGEDGYSRFQRL